LFQQRTIISLTGADFSATINQQQVPLWKPLLIQKDDLLEFKQPVMGARVYLAVQGGWQSEKWLGSYSTHLTVAAGGYWGRALQKDDILGCNDYNFSLTSNKLLPWHISQHELDKIYQPDNIIRCVKSIEWDLPGLTAQQDMQKNVFTISNQSDRMGYRLQGPALSLQQPVEMISSAVDAGTIQLLPDGNLIVLMADHQTTGGYPRIAAVIKADLPKLAQLRTGATICFTIISIKEAEDALISMKQKLVEIKTSCHLNFEKYFHL
jgi:antagonist of KipI